MRHAHDFRKGSVKTKVPDWRVVQLARALRHLTLISRKQVTLTISRVCVVVVLVAVFCRRFSRSCSRSFKWHLVAFGRFSLSLVFSSLIAFGRFSLSLPNRYLKIFFSIF